MAEDRRPTRRIIFPVHTPKMNLTVASPREISLEAAMADAIHIASKELHRYKLKVDMDQSLDLKQARIVQGWMKTLTEINKENRETERAANFEKFSDEELALLAKKVLAKGGSVLDISTPEPEGSVEQQEKEEAEDGPEFADE